MKWCIRKNVGRRIPADADTKLGHATYSAYSAYQGDKLIDGIITDDPKLLREVCERWEDELDGKVDAEPAKHLDRFKDGLSTAFLSVAVQIGALLVVAMAFYKGRLNFFKRGDERRLYASNT